MNKILMAQRWLIAGLKNLDWRLRIIRAKREIGETLAAVAGADHGCEKE